MTQAQLIDWLRSTGWREVRPGYWERSRKVRSGRIRTHQMVLRQHTAELQTEMTDWSRVKKGGAPHWWESAWEEAYRAIEIDADGRLRIRE